MCVLLEKVDECLHGKRFGAEFPPAACFSDGVDCKGGAKINIPMESSHCK